MSETPTFEGWAIVELLGHRRIGAYVREATIGGASVLRLDIPEYAWINGCTCGSLKPDSVDHADHNHTCHAFRAEGDDFPLDIYATQYYSATSALYCLTPTTEQMARAVRSKPEPVQQWELPRHELLPAAALAEREGEYDEYDPDDYVDDVEEELP